MNSLRIGLVALIVSVPAFGQGCAMCNSTAAQADAHQRAALRKGIFVLGVPAALLMGGIGLALYRSNREE